MRCQPQHDFNGCAQCRRCGVYRIGSFFRRLQDFWKKVDRSGGPDACWEWRGRRAYNGYGAFSIRPKVRVTTSRAVWIMLHGEVPLKTEVCHKCDNRACCNPAHLFLGTHGDNLRDMVRKGRSGVAILTPDQVREIRRRAALGEKLIVLADEYGVRLASIERLLARETWASIS